MKTTRATSKKTTTDRAPRRRQRPLVGAVVALALIAAACSGSSEPNSTGPEMTATSTSAASPGLEPGVTLLRNALAGYSAGYSFISDVTVGGEPAIRVEGRRVGDASQQIITSGDGVVEYLIVDGRQWVRTPGEEWDLLAEDGTTSDPLAALSSPISVDVPVAGATRTELDAVYPADAFGLDGDDLVVRLVIENRVLVSAGYESEEAGTTALVETTFGPLEDTTPITTP